MGALNVNYSTDKRFVASKLHVACVWFVRVLFTHACKNVHADVNTYSSVNSNLQMTIVYLSDQKC